MAKDIGILIFGLLLILFGCEKAGELSKEPQTPTSVPKESIWVGGIGGGVFVFIKKEQDLDPDAYWGEIYYVRFVYDLKSHQLLNTFKPQCIRVP